MRGMEPKAEHHPSRAEALRERHERLCFARAFPRSAAELRRAEGELAGFERRVRGVREELDNSGIAGTLCRYPYNHAMATWLARRYGRAVTVDWKEYKRQPWDEVASLLSLVVAEADAVLALAARNVSRVELVSGESLTTYQVLKFDKLLFTRSAFAKVEQRLAD